jgi:hypothetical protein
MGGLICSGKDFGGHGGRIEGLQESPPFMATRPNHNVINGFLTLTITNSAAFGETLDERNIFACIKKCQSNKVANCSGRLLQSL